MSSYSKDVLLEIQILDLLLIIKQYYGADVLCLPERTTLHLLLAFHRVSFLLIPLHLRLVDFFYTIRLST